MAWGQADELVWSLQKQRGMPATALALKMSPTDLVGEIVERRYAVLEHLGSNHYLVYDM